MAYRTLSTTMLAFLTLATMAVAQTRESTTRPDRASTNQGERYEARRVPTDSYRHGQGPTVKEAILKKLQKANNAEIELAKMALQQTDNSELKQLAQTIVQDHQALNKEMEQRLNDRKATQAAQKRSTRSASNQNPSYRNNSNQPSRTTGTERDVATTRPNLNDRSRRPGKQPTVPQEFCEIGEKASENALKMTKEMLGNYEGQDFNMAFLGQQLVAHTMMLAELKAIQSTGPNELHEIAGKSITKVENHLDRAKQLARKLEDDRKTKN